MRLRNTDFGSVWSASGAQGVFGEGYPFHKIYRKIPGFTFVGMTFVAKTTTMNKRKGNILLGEDQITPIHFFPDCIKVKFPEDVVLNAVDVSGPGAKYLLDTGRWQRQAKPYFLSFTSVKDTPEERLAEFSSFVKLLKGHLPKFLADIGLKINLSCPNTGVNPGELVGEAQQMLSVGSVLSIPMVPKFNVLQLTPEMACEIAEHPSCDGICVSNTIPYGEIPEVIPWRQLFGKKSPLKKYGGGGLSGKYLFPLVIDWVSDVKCLGIKKPIIAGGGVLEAKQAIQLLIAGASVVSLGTMAILRPRRMKETIEMIHEFVG